MWCFRAGTFKLMWWCLVHKNDCLEAKFANLKWFADFQRKTSYEDYSTLAFVLILFQLFLHLTCQARLQKSHPDGKILAPMYLSPYFSAFLFLPIVALLMLVLIADISQFWADLQCTSKVYTFLKSSHSQCSSVPFYFVLVFISFILKDLS